MIVIKDIDHVVRVLFPDSLLQDGNVVHPNAFRLRQWPAPKGAERYVSVNHYEADSFVSDLRGFDKGRNLACAKMNVGAIRDIQLFLDKTEKFRVTYDVKDTGSVDHPSHAGIYITIANMPLEGHGDSLFEAIGEGLSMPMHIQMIRRALSDMAGKNLTTVESLCEQKAQQKDQG